MGCRVGCYAWAPYDGYTRARHALCNAHLLRELVAVTESERPAEATGCGQAAIDVIFTLEKAVERALAAAEPGGPVEVDTLGFYTEKLRAIAAYGIEATAAR